jgi:hypothetical protein
MGYAIASTARDRIDTMDQPDLERIKRFVDAFTDIDHES